MGAPLLGRPHHLGWSSEAKQAVGYSPLWRHQLNRERGSRALAQEIGNVKHARLEKQSDGM